MDHRLILGIIQFYRRHEHVQERAVLGLRRLPRRADTHVGLHLRVVHGCSQHSVTCQAEEVTTQPDRSGGGGGPGRGKWEPQQHSAAHRARCTWACASGCSARPPSPRAPSPRPATPPASALMIEEERAEIERQAQLA